MTMTAKRQRGYEVVAFPWMRVPIVDSLRAARRSPRMYALVEADVTAARHCLREHERATGESLSFTGFVIACVARAVEEHRAVQAYRQGRKRLVIFDDVDVCTPVEHDLDGTKQAAPLVIRAANRKAVRAIHREIRAAQARGAGSLWALRARRIYPHLPRPLRTAFWRAFSRYPRLKQRVGGTVMVTAVGMFGKRAAWGVSSVADYTLQVVVGGIGRKPGVTADGHIEAREYLGLTVGADHDVVDGAPLARFVQRLVDLIEAGYGLDDASVSPSPEARAGHVAVLPAAEAERAIAGTTA